MNGGDSDKSESVGNLWKCLGRGEKILLFIVIHLGRGLPLLTTLPDCLGRVATPLFQTAIAIYL
jgi:hypothetical protein